MQQRIMIASVKSGSGKTTLTCALLQALKEMGQKVVSFKCGPDYIDPMFHQQVIEIPSRNLDTFFTGEEQTRQLLLRDRSEEDFVVLEGVMGLFDGLGGIREEGSSYHLAAITQTPILLVVDAKGMGRSVLPLIAGFLSYDKEHLIKGILLNRISKSYYDILKPLLEEELKINVVGYFPEVKEFYIQSRHLGLRIPEELNNIKEQIRKLSCKLQETVCVEQIMEIAGNAPELSNMEEKNSKSVTCPDYSRVQFDVPKEGAPLIAVAKDEAFCFYYEDNLWLLQQAGARLEYFSPIRDTKLPAGTNGILLGGGYPELYALQLSRNKDLLSRIKQVIDAGMPVVAECGGFMYLHSEIQTKDGTRYPMAGVIPAVCRETEKLVRFGYIELKEKQTNFLPEGELIRGHEFHYFDSEYNGTDWLAVKPVTGREYPCIIAGDTRCMGFPHLYYPSNPAFAENFVRKSMKYRQEHS